MSKKMIRCPFCKSKMTFMTAHPDGIEPCCTNSECYLYEGAGYSFDNADAATAEWNAAPRSAYTDLVEAVKQTLEENSHLTDGDDCTLRVLRDAYLEHKGKD